MIVIERPWCVVRIFPEARYVETCFGDPDSGAKAPASREVDEQTLQDAEDLGYERSAAGVWRSLCDHELLHVAYGEAMGGPSAALEHVAGVRHVRIDERYAEEAVVIMAQRHLNGQRSAIYACNMAFYALTTSTILKTAKYSIQSEKSPKTHHF